jgi:hypothetical protein
MCLNPSHQRRVPITFSCNCRIDNGLHPVCPKEKFQATCPNGIFNNTFGRKAVKLGHVCFSCPSNPLRVDRIQDRDQVQKAPPDPIWLQRNCSPSAISGAGIQISDVVMSPDTPISVPPDSKNRCITDGTSVALHLRLRDESIIRKSAVCCGRLGWVG